MGDTCKWVLENELYLDWWGNEHDDLLWISADPGCGKSVLSRFMVDKELLSTTQNGCYFFFKDNDDQNSLATALSALIHQLFTGQPELIEHAVPTWKRTGDSISRETHELWQIFLAAANDSKAYNTVCVLDALDECQERDRHQLISLPSQLYTKSSNFNSCSHWLKFFVTSRPYCDIEDQFGKILSSQPVIRLRGEHENGQIHKEIDLVIQRWVSELGQRKKISEQTQSRLLQKLLDLEHRTYLWLYLATKGIERRCRTGFGPDEELIISLPTSVDDAYEKILSRVEEEDKDSVRMILLCVVGARRALSVG